MARSVGGHGGQLPAGVHAQGPVVEAAARPLSVFGRFHPDGAWGVQLAGDPGHPRGPGLSGNRRLIADLDAALGRGGGWKLWSGGAGVPGPGQLVGVPDQSGDQQPAHPGAPGEPAREGTEGKGSNNGVPGAIVGERAAYEVGEDGHCGEQARASISDSEEGEAEHAWTHHAEQREVDLKGREQGVFGWTSQEPQLADCHRPGGQAGEAGEECGHSQLGTQGGGRHHQDDLCPGGAHHRCGHERGGPMHDGDGAGGPGDMLGEECDEKAGEQTTLEVESTAYASADEGRGEGAEKGGEEEWGAGVLGEPAKALVRCDGGGPGLRRGGGRTAGEGVDEKALMAIEHAAHGAQVGQVDIAVQAPPAGHPAVAHQPGHDENAEVGEQRLGEAAHRARPGWRQAQYPRCPGRMRAVQYAAGRSGWVRPNEEGMSSAPVVLPTEARKARVRGHLAAVLIALAAAVFLVKGPAATLWWTSWGPDRPWVHRDLLGALWLWHAEGHGGTDAWLALQNHPDGAGDVRHHIPNPFDAWVLGPLAAWLGGDLRTWWGASQLAHHLANVAATVVLARSLGARVWGAAAAGVLVAGSPVMLHEVAGGRGLSGAVWPGLLGLSLAVRGNGVWAGVLVGLQGVCYLYAGLVAGLVALLLAPSWGLVVGAAVVTGPYLFWLVGLLDKLHTGRPSADYSILPLPGLWGDADTPARLRMNPLVWLGLGVAVVQRRWRWALAIGLAVLVALGPTPGAKSAVAVVASPLAWLMHWVPGLGRMHHPVRAILLAVPLMAVLLGLRWRRLVVLVAVLTLVSMARPMSEAAAWGEVRSRPGVAQARWLAEHADGAIVDLTGAGDAALGLQPIHGRPMLEGLKKPRGPSASGRLRQAADGWLQGQRQPDLAAELRRQGFTHLLVVARRQPLQDDVLDAIQADLGAPVYPGVYRIR
mgnify:CR=1 FL=1